MIKLFSSSEKNSESLALNVSTMLFILSFYFSVVFVLNLSHEIANPFGAILVWDYYFGFQTLLCFCISGFALEKLFKSQKSYQVYVSKTGAAIFLVAIGLWFLTRYPFIFEYSLWLDEVTQFNPNRFNESISSSAAIEQNPPLDYYLSAFLRQNFGFYEEAVLFHTVLFSFVGSILFVFLLRLMGAPAWLILPFYVLFLCQRTLMQYGAEARPISIAVFFSLLVFFFSYSTLKWGKKYAPMLLVSTIFFLNTIGLQPIFFIVSLILAFVPLLFIDKETSKRIKVVILAIVLGALIFAPTVYHIYDRSVEADQFFEGSLFERWLRELLSLSASKMKYYFSILKGANWVWYLPFVGLVLSFFYFKKNKKSLAFTSGFCVFAAIFPIGFQVFWGAINWALYERYFILWIVGFLAFAGLSFSEIYKSIEKKAVFIGFSFAAAVFLSIYFVPRSADEGASAKRYHVDQRAVSEIIKSRSDSALVVYLPFKYPNNQTFNSLATGFYLQRYLNHNVVNFFGSCKESPRLICFDINSPSDKIDAKVLARDYEKVFYIHEMNHNWEKSVVEVGREIEGKFSGVQVHFVKNGFVVEKKVNGNTVDGILSFFESLIQLWPDDFITYYMQEALLQSYVIKGDKVKAKEMYQNILKMTQDTTKGKTVIIDAFKEMDHSKDFNEYLNHLSRIVQ